MAKYNFKSIPIVPKANDFIDIILSKTQRKTPTVVHPGYEISRIRSFYKRKVKFTQQTIQDKITEIVQSFPMIDDIHPFYADLANILYDKDHYKLALGQLNKAKTLVGQIADNYVRLMKYSDTLYRCKQLKRAAMGRMCTLLKKQASSLGYLEEVRKHLSRLPSIDPTTRTLLICGYPNVGKSSFMNKVTRANVDVQPYPFTTKSLFVGHMDFEYLRWQVIDTPGILDHSLEERNTIEMQSITALAHLQCCILYFIDISCECGYTIEQQLSLFQNIQPLFSNKPVFIICNKIDVFPFDNLSEDYRNNIINLAKSTNSTLMFMSGLAEIGIMEVRNAACKSLLELRVEMKKQSNKAVDLKNKLNIIYPKPRDNNVRSVCIPESVIDYSLKGALPKTVIYTGRTGRMESEEVKSQRLESEIPVRVTQKEIQWERGGPGVYSQELYEHYKGMLKTDEWIADIQPEIMDGKNIFDFYDTEIEEKLKKLEEEEEKLVEEFNQLSEVSSPDSEIEDLFNKIRSKKKILKDKKRLQISRNHPIIPRGKLPVDPDEIKENLEQLYIDPENVIQRGKKRTRGIVLENMENDEKIRKLTHNRKEPVGNQGLNSEKLKQDSLKILHMVRRTRNREGMKGDADRSHQDSMPKFLFSGKRSNGKTDWR